MSTASTLPMRVAVQNRHRKPTGYHFRIETRAGGRDDRNTLCGPGLPPIENLPANPSAVSHALTPLGDGLLARALSTTNLARLGPFLQRGQRWIVNLLRPFGASGSPSFLRSLVHDSNQPTRGLFHSLVFPPVLSLSALHEINMQQEDGQDHGKSIHKHG